MKPSDSAGAAREQRPQIAGMSALLTTTLINMRTTIEALGEAGLCESVRIVIGGAPVTTAFAGEIGPDAYAANAAVAVEVARAPVG